MLSSTRAKSLVGAIVAVAALVGIGVPALEDDPGSTTTLESTAEASPETAPPEAPVGVTFGADEDAAIVAVLAAIESGQPLPYEEDGQTFQNREGLLPSQQLGYYAEYTVETPGSPDRGARRLVIGDGGETYYTDDHYASFTEIDPAEFGQ